ncbi:MAG: tRNA dihydrouridine(20/20a) synthase DusA [Pseudomonadota bacterium]
MPLPATPSHSPWRLSVAPMMEWTDRHCRYFLRLLSRRTRLYTEMVTAPALLHGDAARLLAFNGEEHPVALQLGGSDPQQLARAAELGANAGYDEINLNVGCPSDRVQEGRFGACLMAEPQLVAECVAAMRARVRIPVTVKHRLGIDGHDSYEFTHGFVDTVRRAGCEVFVVHARKAILAGLSPKENREIPPLVYDNVYRLKREFPELVIALNGGVQTLADAENHLARVDGVMIGREAYHNPWLLADADRRLFGDADAVVPERSAVVEAMLPYIERQLAAGHTLHSITRHMLGLYQGMPGARAWRRHLSTEGVKRHAGLDTLRTALAFVENRHAFPGTDDEKQTGSAA